MIIEPSILYTLSRAYPQFTPFELRSIDEYRDFNSFSKVLRGLISFNYKDKEYQVVYSVIIPDIIENKAEWFRVNALSQIFSQITYKALKTE